MTKEITRRDFLQKGSSLATIVGISHTGLVLNSAFALGYTDAMCEKCKAINTQTGFQFSHILGSVEQKRCKNCGCDMITKTIQVDCCDYQRCNAIKIQPQESIICCQIPFPNHKYINNSRKPIFLIKRMRF